MEAATQSAEALRKQINDTEAQLKLLKDQLVKVEAQAVEKSLEELFVKNDGNVGNVTHDPENNSPKTKWPLSPEEYKRYGRQMIVPNIGIQGQLRLKSASVLIIGVGGLGCPAAAYLAGAGVGTIGLVDGDAVETSNLHRQILHSTEKVGWLKVDSAIASLKALNANLTYVGYKEHLTSLNAASIVSHYDLVLDCTDHPTSRYLTSDICILLSKPLISASALRTDGQLIVLNSPPLPQGNTEGGPCYRCVFPKPPPAESVVSCGEGGILGPVVGVMGVLQAGEAVRMIASGKFVAPPTSVLDPFSSTENLVVPNGAEGIRKGIASTPRASMLLFSSASNPPFRTLRLRSRRPNCFACSSTASLTLESLSSGSLDYVLFCGLTSSVKILSDSERITALEYEKLGKEKKHVLLDVREKVQFDICALPGAINIPFSTMQGNRPVEEKPAWLPEDIAPDAPIYVVCRLGNDSQVVARKLKESSLRKNGDGDEDGKRWIGDIKGGLRAWREEVDRNWPEY